ncbi:MAG: Cupredoxin-like domain [Frankiaceae bacterium]|nr:Cupredoxin-like domain [Frankiaceae bacterium]
MVDLEIRSVTPPAAGPVAPNRSRDWEPVLRGTAALALTATAVITVSAVGRRYQQEPVAGGLLAQLLLVQAVLAVAVLSGSSRVYRLTIGFSLVTVAVWAITRTIGRPDGSSTWHAAPVGAADLVASLLELTTAAALVPLVAAAPRRLPRLGLLSLVAIALAGAAAYAVTAPPADGASQLGVVTAPHHGTDRTDAVLPPPSPTGQFSVAEARQAAECSRRIQPVAARESADQTITARDLCFDRAEIVLPANRDVVLHLANAEASTDASRVHALSIYAFDERPEWRHPLVLGTPAAPGTRTDVRFHTPGPGSYFFQCDIHRSMRGIVTVS